MERLCKIGQPAGLTCKGEAAEDRLGKDVQICIADDYSCSYRCKRCPRDGAGCWSFVWIGGRGGRKQHERQCVMALGVWPFGRSVHLFFARRTLAGFTP